MSGSAIFPNITSKFHAIAMLKRFIKRNNDSNETCNYRSLYQASFVSLVSTIVHELSLKTQNMKFSIQPSSMLVFFSFFTKMALLKGVHLLKICQQTKLNCPTLTGAMVASISEV
jgi:hypothetical protein